MNTHTAPVFRFALEAMATTFEILIAGTDKTYANQAAEAVFHEIKRFDTLFNRFDPGSEISLINRLGPGQSMMIGVEIFECLKLSIRLHEITQGNFNVSLGSLKGDGNGLPSIPSPAPFGGQFLPFDISASEKGFEIRLKENFPSDFSLDLGGIGKGFALDKILQVLADWDIEHALIHGGTSTALSKGYPERILQGWPVGVGGEWECPAMPVSVILKNRSLSNSGTEVKGRHIFDPKTGSPATGHLAVWVSHPSAAFADALSTAFMVMNTEEVALFCRNSRDVWTLLVTPEKKCQLFNEDRIKTKIDQVEDFK